MTLNASPFSLQADERAARLDFWLDQVDKIYLSRLADGSEMLPASTASNVHGDYAHAWVRDNVYSILAPWAVAQALKRAGHKPKSVARLEAATRQVMRGLLKAMMRQADKVEKFKSTQDPLDSLHAKYDARTGHAVVGDDGWGHLQVDATSLFVLMLAQMHAAALQLVDNAQEAAFVQNLVHYIGAAYRIADYGIWERGRKTNDGSVEINASSVGMAKGALEAIRGADLLNGDPAGRIHVVPDDIARARETLLALLPNESASKETDAALLSAIFWPAYAIADADLVARTRERMLVRLSGRYGLKRFLRDGHQTAVEDHGRLHYETGELQRFDRIESEWPLFFTYLLVDARLRGDKVNGAHWRMKLDPLFVEKDGTALLPELYYVPEDRVAAEQADPHSQPRVPNDNLPLFWAQALWMIGAMLGEGLLEPDDIDPLGRRHVPGDSERGLRAPIRLVVLAEDAGAQKVLDAQGIHVDTIAGVEAVAHVRNVRYLREWLADVGAEPALGLTGRPKARRLGAMAMSRLYLSGRDRYVFSPTLAEGHDSYLRQDPAHRARLLLGDLRYLSRHARGSDPVLLVATVDEAAVTGPNSEALLNLIKACAGQVPARSAGLGDIKIAWMELYDAMVGLPRTDLGVAPPEGIARPPKPVTRLGVTDRDTCQAMFDEARSQGDREAMEQVQLIAAESGLWQIAREAAESLGYVGTRLADAVKDLVVRLRRLDVSGLGSNEVHVISRPTRQEALLQRLPLLMGRGSGAEAVLAQEIIATLGLIIKAPEDLLKGIRTLRLAELIDLIARDTEGGLDGLVCLAPSEVTARLETVFAQTPNVRAVLDNPSGWQLRAGIDPDQDWVLWRRRLGVLIRVRTDFYTRVWKLLHAVDGLWVGNPGDPAGRINAHVARGDFTSHERDFAQVIESTLTRIRDPRYRALTLEALNVLAEYSGRHPGKRLDCGPDAVIYLDRLIHAAVDRMNGAEDLNEDAWTRAFKARPDLLATALHQAAQSLHPLV
jgi:phosphorylase kinase alpha/beta subunit